MLSEIQAMADKLRKSGLTPTRLMVHPDSEWAEWTEVDDLPVQKSRDAATRGVAIFSRERGFEGYV